MHPVHEKTVRFLIAAVLMVAALTLVSRRTQAPALPQDPDHRAAADNHACSPCHGAGAAAPLGSGHPPKDDCLLCHSRGG